MSAMQYPLQNCLTFSTFERVLHRLLGIDMPKKMAQPEVKHSGLPANRK